MPGKIEDIIKGRSAKRRRHSVAIALDPDDADTWHDLRGAVANETATWERAMAGSLGETAKPARLVEAEAALDAFEAAALDDGRIVEFVFEGIGKPAYEVLRHEHRPSKEDTDAAGPLGARLIRFDDRTFPQALIAASCVDPQMTVDEADKLASLLDQLEFNALFAAAEHVNQGASALTGVDLGKSSRQTRTSDG